ncbi:MAG: hypothetical protein HZA50_03880 [Planctomycetes bacterium]|nr:hypothetical protein [Planctomycetota bacterium]
MTTKIKVFVVLTVIFITSISAVIGFGIILWMKGRESCDSGYPWKKDYSKIIQIDGGCEMYKSDFGSWPMSSRERIRQEMITGGMSPDEAEKSLAYIPAGLTGKELLTLFLTGYASAGPNDRLTNLLTADGQDGFGYRVSRPGQQWGPYGGTDMIQTSLTPNSTRYFVDSFGNPILYYLYDEKAKKYHAEDNPDGPSQTFLDYCRDNYRTSFIVISKGKCKTWPALPISGNSEIFSNMGMER